MPVKTNENDVVDQYLKEVSSTIVSPKGTKGFFLRELKQLILPYIMENDGVTLDMLYHEFGTPDKYAQGLADQDLYAKLLKKAKRKATIWKWVGVILAIFALLAIIYIIFILEDLGGNAKVTNPIQIRYNGLV